MGSKHSGSVDLMLDTLRAYTDAGKIMLGHQNAGHIGISISKRDGTDSDIKQLTGRMPAVVGIDTLSFLGYEGKMADLIKIVKNLHRQGCIITLSSHMPNLVLGGPDTYYDYSPNDVTDDCGHRIMPGGDLNGKFTRFLDMIVKFAGECIDLSGDPIPMIFRPFHECNGDWFWWGRPHLTDEEYIELYRYTVTYLEDAGVKSFAYCYSPNGPVRTQRDYMTRYPGDEYIDIIGLDFYHDRPAINEGFFADLDKSLSIICKIAKSHHVIPALTEIGMRTLDSGVDYYEGLAPSGNPSNWFTDISSVLFSHKIAYILFWSNFSKMQYWIPYVSGDEEHELVSDFKAFALDEHIALAPVIDIGDGMI
ncbi:MAG: hypothetical protein J6Z43_00060 [Clostridiales bacterium]|nr:hypothetical protein [Clostridiales bacterium]